MRYFQSTTLEKPNPNGSVSSFLLTYVTISGVCVLCADSVGAFFYLRKKIKFMNRKKTNEKIAEFNNLIRVLIIINALIIYFIV